MQFEPPQPPEVPRAAKLPAWRWIGLGIVAAVPVLALAGVFGDAQGVALVEEGPLAVEVEWPTRARYAVPGPLRVTVRNRSDAPLDDVSVGFDPVWMEHFEEADFNPAPVTAWTFALPTIAPGASAGIVGELRPLAAGRHLGAVHVTSGGTTVRLDLETRVWP